MDKILSAIFKTKLKAAITIMSVITGLFGIISGVYSAAAWADAHYAHTADINRRLDWIQKDNLTFRRQQLDDKIFELKLQKPTPAIQALIDRYTGQMKALDEQIAAMIKSQNSNGNPAR